MRFKKAPDKITGDEYTPPYSVQWRAAGACWEQPAYHVFATPTAPKTGFNTGLWLLFTCTPDGPVEDEETLKANLLMLAETGLWKELK